MRLFVAIELPYELELILEQEIAGLQRAAEERVVRWVSPQAVHLTLKFLGEVGSDRVPSINEVLDRAAAEVPGFDVEVGGMGCFPNCRRPRVIWIGVDAEESPLEALYSAIERGLERYGFEPERRRFHPHLTVGRLKRSVTPAQQQTLSRQLEQTQIGRLGRIEVRAVSLMRSELLPTGARYTQLHQSELK
jgi:2'-5' RNA ligase